MLKKNGIPTDLKYIALAESALRPHAGSPKGAMGFWQFMQNTGRQYGLTIDDRIDERRSIFASTQAAIRYFKELYRIFGSWTLVAAAFNMGEDGLADEIREQGMKDYYRLYLPIETQRYVLRIISIKLIFSDPKRYGFHLSDEDYYPPLEFDRIQVNCLRDTHLRIIAQAAKTHFKEIKDLNPEIRGYVLSAPRKDLRPDIRPFFMMSWLIGRSKSTWCRRPIPFPLLQIDSVSPYLPSSSGIVLARQQPFVPEIN
jgi:hypothetical protein